MKDLAIIFENKIQTSHLQMTTSDGQRVIEEVTTYLREDGEIFKTSVQREVYNADISMNCMQTFFNSQLNTLTEFYRSRGEFKIKLV